MKKILIAIDDGPTSEKVAKTGFKLAEQLDAEIAIVSVVDTILFMTDAGVAPYDISELIKKDFTKKQKLIVEKIFKDKKIRTFIEEGKPYQEILKVADDWKADIIVLGTHGRTGLNHFIMGSVAEKVSQYSTIPLFIIPIK